jgi:hypothetical protein
VSPRHVEPLTEYLRKRLKVLTRDVMIPEMAKKGFGRCVIGDHWVQNIWCDSQTGKVVGCKPCIDKEEQNEGERADLGAAEHHREGR